ncbi:protein AMN1 homolog [Nematostella vectensis]|uniref:protein AMN1 homolog n=1 Tax=Nematostella vectensis TaxID=45351 RepID=UPI0020773199|nr:protein AMN1 homolog [Nematostella vectensis]
MAAFAKIVSSLDSLQTSCIRAIADHVSQHKGGLKDLPREVKDNLVLLFSKRGLLSDDVLPKIVSPLIRDLDLSESDTSDEGLMALQVCKKLRKLDLNAVKDRRENITSNGIITLSQSCHDLQTVYLRRCTSIGDEAVIALAENCPQLMHLNLGGCLQITDRSLKALAKHSKFLQSLNVSKTKITDTGIFSLTSGCCTQSLKELHLAHCKDITDDGVESVLMLCPNVTILIFHNCPLVTDRSRYAMEEVAQRGGVMKQLSWTVY